MFEILFDEADTLLIEFTYILSAKENIVDMRLKMILRLQVQ